MMVVSAEIRLYAPFAHSLKEKRAVVKSLVAKTRNQFNVSISEIAAQDTLQTIVLGIACVTESERFGQSTLDRVIAFIEANTEAELVHVQREIR